MSPIKAYKINIGASKTQWASNTIHWLSVVLRTLILTCAISKVRGDFACVAGLMDDSPYAVAFCVQTERTRTPNTENRLLVDYGETLFFCHSYRTVRLLSDTQAMQVLGNFASAYLSSFFSFSFFNTLPCDVKLEIPLLELYESIKVGLCPLVG